MKTHNMMINQNQIEAPKMMHHLFISINGRKQGSISDGASSKESVGINWQPDHSDQIIVLSLDHPLTTGEKSGKPKHNPLVFTKYLDKSSPLLLQALEDQEIIDCEIAFYRQSLSDTQEKFYTIKLEGAVIINHFMNMPDVILEPDSDIEETITLRYQTITLTYLDGNISRTGSWVDAE